MGSPAKTAWAASIVGSTIATVIGGVITFHYSSLFTKPDKTAIEKIEKRAPIETKRLPDNFVDLIDNKDLNQVPKDQKPTPKADDRKPRIEAKRCDANIDIRFAAIGRIFDPDRRDAEWAALVSTLIECNDFNRALAATGNMFDPEERDIVYEKIINSLIQQRQFDFALSAIGRVFDPDTRDKLNRRLIAAVQ
jgi:hypothetical protein